MTPLDQYLIDTNVISELRKSNKANPGVLQFFQQAVLRGAPLYLSVITIGELQRGVELIRHRGDKPQAALLETWLQTVLEDYADRILDFTALEAQVWGRLRVPHPHNALDKQIAATALTCDLTLVTRNTSDFAGTGVLLLNPFHIV
ncbi:type II toxin-antitoxin system VapC family toxin [Altericista sp. CCNU0014]|uniref:type II toxin-antitoxin system VapC family toxin n=1 Tax=Altericista sp. CCNU0014 TaxID=3082949 RepID=UPI00384BD996